MGTSGKSARCPWQSPAVRTGGRWVFAPLLPLAVGLATQRNRPARALCPMSLKQRGCPLFFFIEYHLARHLMILCGGLLFFWKEKSRHQDGGPSRIFGAARQRHKRAQESKRGHGAKQKNRFLRTKKKRQNQATGKRMRRSEHGHVGGDAHGRQHRDRRQRDGVALVPARPCHVVGEVAG